MNDDIKKMSQDLRNRISEMAYLMWETAGRQQGMAMEYWLAAEKEVLSTAQQAAETMMSPEKKTRTRTAKPKGDAAKPAAKTAAKGSARKTTTRSKSAS